MKHLIKSRRRNPISLFLICGLILLASVVYMGKAEAKSAGWIIAGIAALIASVICLYIVIRYGVLAKKGAEPAEVMRNLRLIWLSTPPEKIGVVDFTPINGVYGVVMDVNQGDYTFTVLAGLSGDASLYTSGTFGIIGGCSHEHVRSAAKDVCLLAEKYYAQFEKTTQFPYPEPKRVVIYILSKSGTLFATANTEELASDAHSLYPLYVAAYKVITALRLASPIK